MSSSHSGASLPSVAWYSIPLHFNPAPILDPFAPIFSPYAIRTLFCD